MKGLTPTTWGWIACALIGCLHIQCGITQAAPITLYSTQFEAAQGYNSNLDLVGQNEWTSSGFGGNGLGQFFQGYGQSAYIGFGPPTTNGLFLWRPVNHNPTNRPVVTVTFDMLIVDSSNTARRDEFCWSVYNIAGVRLFSLAFANYNHGIYQQLDDDEFRFTGWAFTNDVIYQLKLEMNFAVNRWSAWLEGTQVVTNELITTTNASRTFGDVDAVWLRGGANSGDNHMIFDDLLITADFGTVPPPTLQPLLAVGGGQYLIRVTGTEGAAFAVEASTNLVNWISLKTNVISGGYFDHLDNTAVGHPSRFYRARWVP